MAHGGEIGRTAGTVDPAAGAAVRGSDHGVRVDAARVLTGLRHLEASAEPARVFAGLSAVCVPALCDECLIQITERSGHPYRIRRTWPVGTPIPDPLTDEELIALLNGGSRMPDRTRTGGAVVQTTDRSVLARFGRPPARITTGCWSAGGPVVTVRTVPTSAWSGY